MTGTTKKGTSMKGTSVIGLVRDVLRGARTMARYTGTHDVDAVERIAPPDYDPDSPSGRIAEHTGRTEALNASNIGGATRADRVWAAEQARRNGYPVDWR